MVRGQPIKFVVYGSKVYDEQVPLIEVNQKSTVSGYIDMGIKGLDSIEDLTVRIKEVIPPRDNYDRYEVYGPDLYDISNTNYTYTGIDNLVNKINWRCSMLGITGIEHNNYYGLGFSVNKNISDNVSYQPDIVLHVVDTISKDAINE